MAVLDRYLETLRTPGAEALTFTSNAPVDLVVDGARRTVSRGVASLDQIMMILGEVVPPEVLMKAEVSPQEHAYEGPAGPVRIHIQMSAGSLVARVTPASMPAVLSPRATAPAPAKAADRLPPPPPPRPPSPSQIEPVSSHAPIPASHAAPAGSALKGPARHMDDLFMQMLEFDASDLHLKTGTEPFLRVHGEMTPIAGRPTLGPGEVWALVKAIMPERNQKEFEEARDTDFAYQFKGRARMRCNVFEDIAGVGAVFRQIPSKIRSAKDLGLPAAVIKLCDQPKGLILVTGPTGSGKSTTLAALIDHLNDTEKANIITIEDPVEFVHHDKQSLVRQREVGSSTMSFKAALRAALREDPDVVLVGELRDLETTAIAIETAETGHLVFATLHTNSATSTIDRVINQYPADRQAQIRAMLAESLVGVVSQVLCKKKGGGRVAAIELLIVTPAASNLIREEKTFQLPSVMQTSRGLGMQTMNDALFALVKSGTIEPDEAYDKSTAKKEMALTLTRGGYRGAFSQEPS